MEEAQRQRLQPCLELSPFLLCQYSPRGPKLAYLLLQSEAVRPLLRIGTGLPLDDPLTLPYKPWTSSIGVDLEVHVRIFSWWRLNFNKRKDSPFFSLFFLSPACFLLVKNNANDCQAWRWAIFLTISTLLEWNRFILCWMRVLRSQKVALGLEWNAKGNWNTIKPHVWWFAPDP